MRASADKVATHYRDSGDWSVKFHSVDDDDDDDIDDERYADKWQLILGTLAGHRLINSPLCLSMMILILILMYVKRLDKWQLIYGDSVGHGIDEIPYTDDDDDDDDDDIVCVIIDDKIADKWQLITGTL
uniref:Uncharacterized protein n=1 Tax=Sphaerodactylus townsendi TaxID=933632 RepID=A0ACB8E501_9SAUR